MVMDTLALGGFISYCENMSAQKRADRSVKQHAYQGSAYQLN